MLESKVNLNLQNDFLLNRTGSTVPKKQTEQTVSAEDKHTKKSRIFWSASAAAALIATVTGGIYYLRRGRGIPDAGDEISTIAEEIAHSETVQNIINKKFDFSFGESFFSNLMPQKLKTPEKIVVDNHESLLTNIIKSGADEHRVLKFNDDMSFMQVINGDNIMNILRPADGEFSQISELFIGNNLTPIINKQGKSTNVLKIDGFRPIEYNPQNGMVTASDINKSVAQKVVRQYDLDNFLDCYELAAVKPLGNTMEPATYSEKLLSRWRHKLDIDSTIDDIATQTGKSKEEVYKIIHSQKFRDIVRNQQEIIDDGYNEVCEILHNDFGLKPDIQKPLTNYKDVLKAYASRGTIARGSIRNHVVDGFDMTPKMTNCTHIYNTEFGSDKACLGGHYTYNPDKSFINYNDDFKSIERYTPAKITDTHPKYTTLTSEKGGFMLIERPSNNELTLVNSTGENMLRIKYQGDIKAPKIEQAELTSKVQEIDGVSGLEAIKKISADNETLKSILINFEQDMYLSKSAIAQKQLELFNELLTKLL